MPLFPLLNPENQLNFRSTFSDEIRKNVREQKKRRKKANKWDYFGENKSEKLLMKHGLGLGEFKIRKLLNAAI